MGTFHPTSVPKAVRLVCLAFATVLVTGCLHLYDAEKDTVARQAKEKYEAIKLDDVFTARRANFDALEAKFVAAAKDRTESWRDLYLADWIHQGGSVRILVLSEENTRLDSRRKRLNVSTLKDLEEKSEFLENLRTAANDLADQRSAFRKQVGSDPLPCLADEMPPKKVPKRYIREVPEKKPEEMTDEDFKALKREIADFNTSITKLYGAYFAACRLDLRRLQSLAGPRKCQRPGASGELPQTCPKDDIAKTAQKALGSMIEAAGQFKEAEEQNEAFKKAKKEYEAALKKASAGKDKEELAAKLSNVHSALGFLEKAQGVIGVKLATEVQLKAADTLIGATTSGKIDNEKLGDDPGLKVAAAVLSSASSLQKEVDELKKKLPVTGVAAALLQRTILQARLRWANAVLNAQMKRIALYRNKLRVYAGEIETYLSANYHLCYFARVARLQFEESKTAEEVSEEIGDECLDDLFAKEWSSTSDRPDDPLKDRSISLLWERDPKTKRHRLYAQGREELISALAELGTALSFSEAQLWEIEVRLAMLGREPALAQAEMSVRMWDATIRGPLTQIAGYHQLGIPPAELADLLVKAAGFAAIGVGANR